MWVIFVEVTPLLHHLQASSSPRRRERRAAVPQLFQYAATVVVPDSEFVTFQLTNGIKLPWLQYMSWVATVPVLLMYLVSLTAHGGRSATVTPRNRGCGRTQSRLQRDLTEEAATPCAQVPLVPLLVSGLMMLLLGITAAACSPPLKWFAFGVACCFGGMVFASVAQCFRALYLIVPAYAYAKGAARCLVGGMGLAFVGGWLLFPLMFALGHLGADLISRDLEAIGQFFGATDTPQSPAATPRIQAAIPCIQAATPCAQAATPCPQAATPCIQATYSPRTLSSRSAASSRGSTFAPRRASRPVP